MDSMLYPTFEYVDGRGWIPRIKLPKDFKELVGHFYQKKREETIEDYADKWREHSEERGLMQRIRLQWNNILGLTNISVGTSGLDLNTSGWPGFQEHNLGGSYSFIAGSIAMKYVSELMKSGAKL